MPRVLLTAFEPYDQWEENSSWLALIEFTKHRPEAPEVVTRRYPVDYQRMQQRLEDDLQQPYDYVLHMGQAPGSARIRLEAIALNVGGAVGQLPDEYRPLEPGGPTAYQSDLPLANWASRLRFAGIPAVVSHHAGTYLCNAILYRSLHFASTWRKPLRATFLHLPLAPQQVATGNKDMPTMSPEVTSRALQLILQELLKI